MDKFGFDETNLVPLGQLISPAKIEKCGNRDLPVLSMTMRNGLVLQSDKFKKVIASVDKSQYKLVYKNQLVISFPIDEGVLATQRIVDVGIVSPAYAVWDVDESLVVPEYLEYALRCERAISHYKSKLRGSTARRRTLPTPTLLEFTVPVPSIETQYLILKRINLAHAIQVNKRKQLDEIDIFIKARFVEMFGDRYINDKGWKTDKLGDVLSFHNGKAHEQVVDENGDYILVTSKAVASGMRDFRRTNEQLFPLRKNDITMVMSDVPNGRALASCYLIEKDDKYTLNQRICSFDDYEYNPTFLLFLLSRHPYFLSFNDGNGQTNLRKEDILNCMLIIPPLDLQNQFADFVTQVDKLKVEVQKSLDELQTLFDSLMQQYFG